MYVIFDFDGVIVDSISGLKKLYFEYAKNNLNEDFDVHNGTLLQDIIKLLPKYTQKLYHIGLNELYQGLRPTSDFICLYEWLLKKGIKIGIVSSCDKKYIDFVMKDFDVDVIVGGNDVKQGKPHPDIYLKLLTTVEKNDIICVIEDSENGILASLECGLSTIQYIKNIR